MHSGWKHHGDGPQEVVAPPLLSSNTMLSLITKVVLNQTLFLKTLSLSTYTLSHCLKSLSRVYVHSKYFILKFSYCKSSISKTYFTNLNKIIALHKIVLTHHRWIINKLKNMIISWIRVTGPSYFESDYSFSSTSLRRLPTFSSFVSLPWGRCACFFWWSSSTMGYVSWFLRRG